MPKMLSVLAMTDKCRDLIGSGEVSDWANSFLITVCTVQNRGGTLSDKQIVKLIEIYRQNFDQENI